MKSFYHKSKPFLKKVGRSVYAGLTSTEAVKAEKYLAVVVLTRLSVSVPVLAVVLDKVIAGLS